MCGVHCINALLQGPYFDEVEMSSIAQKLDEEERLLMSENGTTSNDYLKYMQVLKFVCPLIKFSMSHRMSQMMAITQFRCSREHFKTPSKYNVYHQKINRLRRASKTMQMRKLIFATLLIIGLQSEKLVVFGTILILQILYPLVHRLFQTFTYQHSWTQLSHLVT